MGGAACPQQSQQSESKTCPASDGRHHHRTVHLLFILELGHLAEGLPSRLEVDNAPTTNCLRGSEGRALDFLEGASRLLEADYGGLPDGR